MRLGHLLATAVVCIGVATLSSAQAATIDFGGLSGSNGTAFNGPYVEDGYTVTRIGGQVFEGHAFGNPLPSLVVGSVFGGGTNGDLTVSFGGGTFTLGSFDVFAQSAPGSYNVFGLLGGSQVFSLSATFGPFGFGSPWLTVSGNAGAIDSLVFRLQATGSSLNLDNIVVNAVSVPGPLVGAGLPGLVIASGGLMLWYRRRQQALA